MSTVPVLPDRNQPPDGADAATWIPTTFVGKLEPNTFCRGWNEPAKKYCRQRAGAGTVHPSQGRCKWHGGLQDGDGRMKTGRYSIERGGITHQTISDLYERFLEDTDPTGLFDEIALLKALTVNFINEHETRTAALVDWYNERQGVPRDLPVGLLAAIERATDLWEKRMKETDDWSPDLERRKAQLTDLLMTMRSQEPDKRPRKVSDIADAAKLLDDIGRMADRIETMRAKDAISEAELSRIITAMGRAVDVLVSDQATKDKIREAWLGIVTR